MTDFRESAFWERFIPKFEPGTRWLALMQRATNFGIIFEMPGYLQAVAHISELGAEDQDDLHVMRVGALVSAMVLYFDSSAQRMGISLRAAVGTGTVQASPVPINPAWRTDDVLGIARRMQHDAYSDPRLVPILADALEEAGCDDIDLLEVCRAPNMPTYHHGWWIAEALLRA